MYVMGDNGVFKRASDARLKTNIAKYQEMLETSKGPIIIDGLGTFNPEDYFQYIQDQGIIEDKETDVIDNGDGTYDVTTKPGYIFLVELMPTKENPVDAKIEYLGQAGKVAPIIKKIETSSTTSSITAKAIVVRLGNGTVTYYYKLASASDSEYQEITNVNEETGATQSTGITAGEKYTIKVIAKNEVGEVVSIVEVLTGPPTLADIVDKIQEENKTIEDENGNSITIPGGFKVVPDTEENDVDYTYSGDKKPCVQDGIVIEDEEGNQFVWIPVGNIKNKDGTTTTITLGRYTFDTTDATPILKQNADDYERAIEFKQGLYSYQELLVSNTYTPAKELGNFVNKAKENKGYYLARYEASRGADNKVKSKREKEVWSGITQRDSAEKAQQMYSNEFIESDLINSYSWDTAIVFIQEYSENNKYANKKSINDKDVGILNTGKSGDKVCNIYDMASNCSEWSTEKCMYNVAPCVDRGGSYNSSQSYNYTNARGSSSVSINDKAKSFRPLLYIK